ncbi:serine hydrolase domain-containing protein [Steroidobacter cummioxidans]|uniref:serine hydrolase domain-containing protein n=1 Tax=Steroidobacter cummioxidans TaxID=1803913 RepID=UPI0019D48DB3|nr:serine hydrolase [Steroidobacter cummioxidans]
MRVMSREQLNSRSELIRRCRQVAIGVSLALSIAACGGGGGGGGGTSAPVQQNPQNVAPTVRAGDDQTIEWPTASAQLSGSATDDSSSTLTYAWSATSGPSGVTFGTANAAATSVTFPAAGSYVLTLSVSDGSLTGTDTVNVTVNAATYPASDLSNDTNDHGWTRVTAAADVGMNQALLEQAATYAQTSGRTLPNSAGMIVRKGRLVHSWGNIDQRFDLKSTTKSIGGMALGIAYDGGSLALTDRASARLPGFGENPPGNVSTGWLPDITIQQLATHSAGFRKIQSYPALDYRPGTTFFYSDGGLNWLADTLTAVFNQDLATVLNTNVWSALGVNSSVGGTDGSGAPAISDVHWRDNQSGRTNPQNRELASGIFANANAMARVGLLFLRKGVWANDQRILSEDFVSKVSTPVAENAGFDNPEAADFPGGPENYGMLWWTNANGQLPNVPRDAYWAWGLGDSLIVVIPSLDIVAVRAGRVIPGTTDPDPDARVWNDWDWNGDYSILAPFLDPIVQSVIQ